ncbi:hypothetical protein F8M41_007835 [Gigaspora margarita]|uniref:CCHC-type domain-containing protein n=1 Tax=Gigaspora margarita TaxID=4874 RepID=A0A8H4EQZ9_GIGMA|nr:hypothetical protein F8M41_007835 [Gigaspora margarita]
MAQLVPFKLPKIIGLENAIPEFDGTIAKYKEWRDTVERAFTIKGITTLMIFGRYSGNTDTGYTQVAKGHNGTEDDPARSVAKFVVNFNRQVFTVIATKLKGTTLLCYKTNEARANLAHAANHPNADIVQVGFREIFDEQFITEAVQETYQQQFLKYRFVPNWNDENSFDKYRQSIRQNKINSGKAQTDLRINRFLMKETTNKKFKRINNVDTTRRNDKRNNNCFNCNQPGHYARNCPLQRKKKSFNRIETSRNSQGKLVQKNKYCSICRNARLTILGTAKEITNIIMMENLQKDQHQWH